MTAVEKPNPAILQNIKDLFGGILELSFNLFLVGAQAAITKSWSLGGLSNRNLLSPACGGWKSTIRFWGKLSSGLADTHLLTVSSLGRESAVSFSSSSYKAAYFTRLRPHLTRL